MNQMIEPINERQRQQVCELTQTYIEKAEYLFDFKKDSFPVLFDLKGRVAGMYRVSCNDRCIRFNPFIFSKYFDDNLATTVPHEVAHYVTDCIYGLKNIRPHGKEWRQVMLKFDANPSVTGRYDLTGIPVRRQRRIRYQCDCMSHDLSMQRHNNFLRGKTVYRCTQCGHPLLPS